MASKERSCLHDQNRFQRLELWVTHSSSYWRLLTLLSMFSSTVKQLASVPLITSPWKKKLNFNTHRFVILCFDCLHSQTSLKGLIQHTFGANTAAHLGQIQQTFGANTAHLHTVWKILHTFSLWSYMASYNKSIFRSFSSTIVPSGNLTMPIIDCLRPWAHADVCRSMWITCIASTDRKLVNCGKDAGQPRVAHSNRLP